MTTPLLIFFLLIATLFVAFVIGVSRAERDARNLILRKGQLAEAEILYYEQDEHLLVYYRFTPQGEQEPITCNNPISPWSKRFLPGTIVPVRYMLKYPSMSLLVPYASRWSRS
ncbi:hypothetical protein [Pseudoxanthomonas sp.]|uniref:hypothetical protein n=1 Tax=Pseudoxanthomonas sp. TaxID=1871049 RepID=UPI002E0E96B0|nr:hypothetical protein [Pseudoxanthomonas sp.]